MTPDFQRYFPSAYSSSIDSYTYNTQTSSVDEISPAQYRGAMAEDVKAQCRRDIEDLKKMVTLLIPASADFLSSLDLIFLTLFQSETAKKTFTNESFVRLLTDINSHITSLYSKNDQQNIIVALILINEGVTKSHFSNASFLNIDIFKACLESLQKATQRQQSTVDKPTLKVAPFMSGTSATSQFFAEKNQTALSCPPGFPLLTTDSISKKDDVQPDLVRQHPKSHAQAHSKALTCSKSAEFGSTEREQWPIVGDEYTPILRELATYNKQYEDYPLTDSHTHRFPDLLTKNSKKRTDLNNEIQYFDRLIQRTKKNCPLLVHHLEQLKNEFIILNDSSNDKSSLACSNIAYLKTIIKKLQRMERSLTDDSIQFIIILIVPEQPFEQLNIHKSLWLTSRFLSENTAYAVNEKVKRNNEMFGFDLFNMVKMIGKTELEASLYELEHRHNKTLDVQRAITADESAQACLKVDEPKHSHPKVESANSELTIRKRHFIASNSDDKQQKKFFKALGELCVCVFPNESLNDELDMLQVDMKNMSLPRHIRQQFSELENQLNTILKNSSWLNNKGNVQAAIISLFPNQDPDLKNLDPLLQQSKEWLSKNKSKALQQMLSASILKDGTSAYQMALTLKKTDLAYRLKPKANYCSWVTNCNIL